MTELEAARERLRAGLAMAERYNGDRIEFGEQGDAIRFDDIRTLLDAKVEVVVTDGRLIDACKTALLRLADEELDADAADQMREQAAELSGEGEDEDRDAALRMFRYVLEALYAHTGGGDE